MAFCLKEFDQPADGRMTALVPSPQGTDVNRAGLVRRWLDHEGKGWPEMPGHPQGGKGQNVGFTTAAERVVAA